MEEHGPVLAPSVWTTAVRCKINTLPVVFEIFCRRYSWETFIGGSHLTFGSKSADLRKAYRAPAAESLNLQCRFSAQWVTGTAKALRPISEKVISWVRSMQGPKVTGSIVCYCLDGVGEEWHVCNVCKSWVVAEIKLEWPLVEG